MTKSASMIVQANGGDIGISNSSGITNLEWLARVWNDARCQFKYAPAKIPAEKFKEEFIKRVTPSRVRRLHLLNGSPKISAHGQ